VVSGLHRPDALRCRASCGSKRSISRASRWMIPRQLSLKGKRGLLCIRLTHRSIDKSCVRLDLSRCRWRSLRGHSTRLCPQTESFPLSRIASVYGREEIAAVWPVNILSHGGLP
jgi:hypothetical protein